MPAILDQKQQCRKNTATSTFDFGDICWNLSEIHWIVWEIDEKAQTSFVSNMRMRIDHGHMQAKILTNRDESFFENSERVENTMTKRDEP